MTPRGDVATNESASLVNVAVVERLVAELPASTVTELILEGLDDMHYRNDADQVLSDAIVNGMSTWLETVRPATTLSLDKFLFECETQTADRFMLALQSSALTVLQLNACRNRLNFALPPTLAHLTLSNTRSSLQSHQNIVDALDNTESRLQTLDLSWHSMYPEYFSLLAEALPTSNLVQLDLSYSHVMDDGAHALVSVLPQTRLQELDLSYNEIQDDGGMGLAIAIRITPNLRKVSLQGNFLGEPSLRALVDVVAHRTDPMTCLDLKYNDILSPDAVEGIRALMANVMLRLGTTCVVLSSSSQPDASSSA
ncbi:hypothetical protein DYB32_001218 [Aphanomyces invadans]|uniref:Uncharacterized protein n=1 Tax=Aphanomyces invadans TaxID=157072 RepID=A0A418B734_9STRA|nr:hypothetical protein DYB32_001218 [Aphanomyces invadans]